MTNKQKIYNLYTKQKPSRVIETYKEADTWWFAGFIVLGSIAWGMYFLAMNLINYYG